MKKKLFIYSLLFPLISIVIFPPQEKLLVGKLHEYAMGFPIRFMWYRSFDEFKFYKLFSPPDLKLQINLLYYFFSVVIIYIFLLCLVRVIKLFK